MTKTLNQIFFFLHQNQNIFFSNIGNQNIFLEKKHIPPPFKLNGRSLIRIGLLRIWFTSIHCILSFPPSTIPKNWSKSLCQKIPTPPYPLGSLLWSISSYLSTPFPTWHRSLCISPGWYYWHWYSQCSWSNIIFACRIKSHISKVLVFVFLQLYEAIVRRFVANFWVLRVEHEQKNAGFVQDVDM
jgi:hypothetical protein